MKVHAVITEEGCNIANIQLFIDVEKAKALRQDIAVREFGSIKNMDETLEKEIGFKGLNVYIWPDIEVEGV